MEEVSHVFYKIIFSILVPLGLISIFPIYQIYQEMTLLEGKAESFFPALKRSIKNFFIIVFKRFLKQVIVNESIRDKIIWPIQIVLFFSVLIALGLFPYVESRYVLNHVVSGEIIFTQYGIVVAMIVTVLLLLGTTYLLFVKENSKLIETLELSKFILVTVYLFIFISIVTIFHYNSFSYETIANKQSESLFGPIASWGIIKMPFVAVAFLGLIYQLTLIISLISNGQNQAAKFDHVIHDFSLVVFRYGLTMMVLIFTYTFLGGIHLIPPFDLVANVMPWTLMLLQGITVFVKSCSVIIIVLFLQRKFFSYNEFFIGRFFMRNLYFLVLINFLIMILYRFF